MMQSKIRKEIKNHMFIIFGSTGDLAKRKLIPALYYMCKRKALPKNLPIVCVGRKDLTKKEYLDHIETDKFLKNEPKVNVDRFLKRIYYVKNDFSKESYPIFEKNLRALNKIHSTNGNMLFYLALPPKQFIPAKNLIQSIHLSTGFRRVAFEKPFGTDLKSAKELNKCVRKVFKENEIFRIDHYLGKELVQNILTFRFSNAIFEEIWNSKFVDNVQISLSETVGIENRGNYYDKTGAVKDMIQNHMLQVLSLTAMDVPKSLDPNHIRNQKVKVLKNIKRLTKDDVVLGQYDAGKVDDKQVVSYLKEKKIQKNSKTETYAALRFHIKNKRWKGVPFYVRTGKRMGKKFAEINVVLKDVSCKLFSQKNYFGKNVITISIQPYEGISVTFNSKLPGYKIVLDREIMDFCYSCKFWNNTHEAYENLFFEIMRGDQTLFPRWDGVEESWKIVSPIIKFQKNHKLKIHKYPSGSFGPKIANKLLADNGHKWIFSRIEQEGLPVPRDKV